MKLYLNVARRKPGPKPRRVPQSPSNLPPGAPSASLQQLFATADSPRPPSHSDDSEGGISTTPLPTHNHKEGRPRNLGRGVSKPKKNTVASLLAQSRALGKFFVFVKLFFVVSVFVSSSFNGIWFMLLLFTSNRVFRSFLNYFLSIKVFVSFVLIVSVFCVSFVFNCLSFLFFWHFLYSFHFFFSFFNVNSLRFVRVVFYLCVSYD